MARKSQKVTFSSEYLKVIYKDHGLTMGTFAEKVAISRTTLQLNMKEQAISRDNLVSIGKFFKLDRKQFSMLLGEMPQKVFFRRERRAEAEEDAKDKVRDLAKTFFNVAFLKDAKRSRPTFSSLGTIDLAAAIRQTLELEHYQISFKELVNTLSDFGIYVFFYPFSYLGISDTNCKNYRAASIPHNNKWIVLLDVKKALVDSLYDLLHELTHIFADHNFDDHNDELESFCNDVAAEILTPKSFFDEHRSVLEKVFSKPTHQMVGEAEKVQRYLGCSFEGLILALCRNGIIKENVKRYLYACNRNKKESQTKIQDYFPNNSVDIDAWEKKLSDDSLSIYFDFFSSVKASFLSGKVSTRLIASIFNLDISHADTMCKKWLHNTEFTQEELDRFKDGPCHDY